MLRTLYRQTGIRQRGSVLLSRDPAASDEPHELFRYDAAARGPSTAERMQWYEREAAPLATAASRRALSDAAIEPPQVTHLVTVSCSGFSAPGFDVALAQALELPASVERTHLGFMGCHGALNALRVASAITSSNPSAAVLLAAIELCTLHHQYSWRPDLVVANALFADGAAAAAFGGQSFARRSLARQVCSGSGIVANTQEQMGWLIRDHGFEMTLSAQVPLLIERELGPWIEPWLERQGYDVKSIGSWAFHPGGPRILSACAAALDLPDDVLEPAQAVLEQHGNMSSPTILFVLDELRRQQAPFPWVALAFGPGLTIEAALFESE